LGDGVGQFVRDNIKVIRKVVKGNAITVSENKLVAVLEGVVVPGGSCS
jgi:glutamine amidotransferase PdxT